MEEIPTNTILNKVMTGCGATTLEINAARHSIIIEPNVPVIIGKKAQHDFLFAVYEGTTREDVKAYLAGEEDGYRKIITTPEGFDKKVLPAMYELSIPVYEEYFLLFDECEKPIQDVAIAGTSTCPSRTFSSSRVRRWYLPHLSSHPTLGSRNRVLRCCVSSPPTTTVRS